MKRPLPLLLLLSALLAVLPAPASAQASPGGCELAPAPRLHVGDEVVVSPEIGQVNLRSLPAVSTGIETALYQGNRLTVRAKLQPALSVVARRDGFGPARLGGRGHLGALLSRSCAGGRCLSGARPGDACRVCLRSCPPRDQTLHPALKL
jgi:hypothetical protein